MSVGGGKSSQSSRSASESRSFVAPFQQQFLTNMLGQAQQTFERINPALQGAAEGVGQEAQNVNRELVGRQRQIAGGSNPFIQNLLQRTGGANPFLQQQVDALGTDIGRFAQEQLQGVGSGFATANQFGSSRQGLAEGQVIGRALEEFQQGAAGLRADDLVNQQQAAIAGAGLQLDASQAGQAGAAQLFELGLAPLLSQFGALESFAGLIGDPTVLAESASSSRGKGSSTSFNVGVGDN